MINKKGFTLIELIIVMAIISILVVVAGPKYMDHVNEAKLTQVKNDMKVAENIFQVDMANALANDKELSYTGRDSDGKMTYAKADVKVLDKTFDKIQPSQKLYQLQNAKIAKKMNSKLDLKGVVEDNTVKKAADYVFYASAETGEIFVEYIEPNSSATFNKNGNNMYKILKKLGKTPKNN